jgi:hypothetical protein
MVSYIDFGPTGPTGPKGETGGNWINEEVKAFNVTGDTGPIGGQSGPTGPTATNPPYVTQSIIGAMKQVTESISSTGPYTTTFSLGFGPTMIPDESLLIQGVFLDPKVNATLLGFTGYQTAGLF